MKQLIIVPLLALLLLAGYPVAMASAAEITTANLNCEPTKANAPYLTGNPLLPPTMVGSAAVNCLVSGTAIDATQMRVSVRMDKLCLMRRRTTGASRPWTAKRGCNRSTAFVPMHFVRPLAAFTYGFEMTRSVLRANRQWYWQTWLSITIKATYRGRTLLIPRRLWVSPIETYFYK